MGASLPDILVRAFLHAAMLLADDGGGAHEVLWQRNDHEVVINTIFIAIFIAIFITILITIFTIFIITYNYEAPANKQPLSH